MPKHHKVYKLSRDSQARKALMVSLLQALILEEAISTTTQKAKFIKPEFDKLISLAKRSSLSSRRKVQAIIGNKVIVEKLYQYLLPRLQSRNSGYTTLIHLANRPGDNAQMTRIAIIFDLVETDQDSDQSKQKKETKSESKPKKSVKEDDKPSSPKGDKS